MAHPYKDKMVGSKTAEKRYGSGSGQSLGPLDSAGHAPQAPEDKQAPGYDNMVPNNWLRGMGKGEAEGKPSFDHQKKE